MTGLGTIRIVVVQVNYMWYLSSPFRSIFNNKDTVYKYMLKMHCQVDWTRKECSNQKVEENKPALKLNPKITDLECFLVVLGNSEHSQRALVYTDLALFL